jgi:L-asparaginase II
VTDPVLVTVTRGNHSESFHRAAVSVVDADGRSIISCGDVNRRIFPRSAIKAFQALPLVESGAADKFCFDNAKLALACSSHGGEPEHVALAQEMLANTGCDCSVLACGAHWPMNEQAAYGLARQNKLPSRLHNACSGKHIGFVCLAQTIGAEPSGYHLTRHPVQREVKAAIESLAGTDLRDEDAAIDGCSVPTWPIPLSSLALAFARFGTGIGLSPERSRAASRLRAACSQEPWYVGGSERFCTEMMRLLGGRVFLKFGAEGVFCAAIPEEGVGIAIKCNDGANRAAQILVAAVIRRVLKADIVRGLEFEQFLLPQIKDWNGNNVGSVMLASQIG